MSNVNGQMSNVSFVFFGTPQISVDVLNILKAEGFSPSLVVTSPDKPQGRGMRVSPPPVKVWAVENNIPVLQPGNLDPDFTYQLTNLQTYKLFVVVAYGKILPKEIIDIPEKGTINLHYSLLPKLRGSSPVETAILDNINPTGVSTILMDEKMDHGPILLQEEVYFENWPLAKEKIFEELNERGGKILAKTIKLWTAGEIKTKEQDDSNATYTKKIKKDDGLIDLNDNSALNYQKYLTYHPWPGIFFFKDGKRIKITDAELKDSKLLIKKIIPEGKKEADYKNFK